MEFQHQLFARENDILAVNAAHFAGLLPIAWGAANIPFERQGDELRPQLNARESARIWAWWRTRARLGKPFNLARLVKASTTFAGAARYAAWKIERHTGVPIEITPWREKHPVLAAPAVLWRVWRSRR